MQRLIFTVTTDINYDQRMCRICTSLSAAGYDVILIGNKKKDSKDPAVQSYRQVRIPSIFGKGKLFYIEYNIRLFFFLLFQKMDAICAIDLDTIIPVYYISKIKKCKRIYDAHELFCEMKEIVTRPYIYKFWKNIEKKFVPEFQLGYTVNKPIAESFHEMYGRNYEVVQNMAEFKNPALKSIPALKYFYYQGAVNEGRSFETIIPAMKTVDANLVICGTGNFMQQAKKLVKLYGLEHKIIFTGMLSPDDLEPHAQGAFAGLTIFENNGLSNYYSLANRFFDYVQAGIPQICVDYPVYNTFNKEYNVGLMISDTSILTISTAMNNLLKDEKLWKRLQEVTVQAAQVWNWETEAKTLVKFYKENVFR